MQIREPTIVAVDKFSGKLLKSGMTRRRCLADPRQHHVPIQPICGRHLGLHET